MQPRRDLVPLRLEMVFHVTKRGYCSSRLPKAYGRREDSEEEEGLVVDEPDESVRALREDAVERVDGVEELEPEPEPEPERSRRRDTPGRRREAVGRRSFLAAEPCCPWGSISSTAPDSSSVFSESFSS